MHGIVRRRRSSVERLWIDWQVRAAARAAVDVHRPQVALVLGDQFDEGGRWTSDSNWDDYVGRFFRAFASFLPLKTLYLVGNHDTSFGRDMRIEDLKRYEVAFGAANRIEEIEGHTFVSLNTMALDSDVTSKDVQTEARSFLENDLQCGEERQREAGHVTYEAPDFKYETHHHVLSRELSAELLDKVQPDLVLSGHTHAWCEYQHSTAMEYTVPAFSWGQRPDPSYALLRLPQAGTAGQLDVTICHLPKEPLVFAMYAVTIIIIVLAHVVRFVWRLRAPRTKEKGA
ncbi:Metallophosphoesterase 1 [Phytophthora palmivora]|uniref:Metallophosphoesterase 1 n=1 Tax=Phytophthora palmivora TaxID=4796 RepID=A0A2P4YEJ6_9STRA|nr:Metallophosphoesterase 1 [Phytophthora palmivora]